MVANKRSYISSVLYYSHCSWLANLACLLELEMKASLVYMNWEMALHQCLQVREYRAVIAVCLDSSQKVALNHGDKFSAASLKPFVLANRSSEKVTLSTALMEEIWPLRSSSRSTWYYLCKQRCVSRHGYWTVFSPFRWFWGEQSSLGELAVLQQDCS